MRVQRRPNDTIAPMLALARLTVLLSLAVAAFPGAARAQVELAQDTAATTAYGVAFTDLYRINLVTRVATYVGFSGTYNGQLIGHIRGLSFLPNGELYGVSGNLRALVKLDVSRGTASVAGLLNLDGTGQFGTTLDLGMTYGCDGNFWMTSAVTGQLWKVDPATAQPTLVGSTGHRLTGIVAYGNTLYGAGGQGDTGFYKINPQTAQATLVGDYGPALPWVNVVGMSFDEDGTLYATLNYNPGATSSSPLTDWSDLATIDTRTGVVTKLGAITGPSALRRQSMNGFAIAGTQCDVPTEPVGTPYEYVPVPAAPRGGLALLAGLLGLVAGGFLVRRRA